MTVTVETIMQCNTFDPLLTRPIIARTLFLSLTLLLSCTCLHYTPTNSYYKNVRKEWASLVSTPPYAQFQDALAFTRSLGDLHLHTYGERVRECGSWKL